MKYHLCSSQPTSACMLEASARPSLSVLPVGGSRVGQSSSAGSCAQAVDRDPHAVCGVPIPVVQSSDCAKSSCPDVPVDDHAQSPFVDIATAVVGLEFMLNGQKSSLRRS